MKITFRPLEDSLRRRDTYVALPVFLFLGTLTGCERSYDDCILKNMRGVTSNVAAAEIRRSCRAKFPEAAEVKPGQRELDPFEVAALTGRAAAGYGNTFEGSLYNGNNNITVSQVRVRVAAKIGGTRLYRICM